MPLTNVDIKTQDLTLIKKKMQAYKTLFDVEPVVYVRGKMRDKQDKSADGLIFVDISVRVLKFKYSCMRLQGGSRLDGIDVIPTQETEFTITWN